jgi:uncharacterized membrane protein
MFATSLISVVNFLFVKYLEKPLGYQNIFYIGGAGAVFALAVHFVLDEKLDFDRLNKRGMIEQVGKDKISTDKEKGEEK